MSYYEGGFVAKNRASQSDPKSNLLRLLGIARYEDEHGDKAAAVVLEWACDEIVRLRRENEDLARSIIRSRSRDHSEDEPAGPVRVVPPSVKSK